MPKRRNYNVVHSKNETERYPLVLRIQISLARIVVGPAVWKSNEIYNRTIPGGTQWCYDNGSSMLALVVGPADAETPESMTSRFRGSREKRDKKMKRRDKKFVLLL